MYPTTSKRYKRHERSRETSFVRRGRTDLGLSLKSRRMKDGKLGVRLGVEEWWEGGTGVCGRRGTEVRSTR